MKTIEISLYKFDELSQEAKQNAINELSDINVDYNWWEFTYEDANNIGLKITSFNLDRNRQADGCENEENVNDQTFYIYRQN